MLIWNYYSMTTLFTQEEEQAKHYLSGNDKADLAIMRCRVTWGNNQHFWIECRK